MQELFVQYGIFTVSENQRKIKKYKNGLQIMKSIIEAHRNFPPEVGTHAVSASILCNIETFRLIIVRDKAP